MPSAAFRTERAATGLVAVDGRTFPLTSTRLRGRAAGGVAFTTLSQEYANPHAEPLEVLYTLPLPADGAVIGYTIRLGARVVRGEIERREAARDRYLRALEEGRTAGLLEQERADTFTQTLGRAKSCVSRSTSCSRCRSPAARRARPRGSTASRRWPACATTATPDACPTPRRSRRRARTMRARRCGSTSS
jgi:hypothetical protein